MPVGAASRTASGTTVACAPHRPAYSGNAARRTFSSFHIRRNCRPEWIKKASTAISDQVQYDHTQHRDRLGHIKRVPDDGIRPPVHKLARLRHDAEGSAEPKEHIGRQSRSQGDEAYANHRGLLRHRTAVNHDHRHQQKGPPLMRSRGVRYLPAFRDGFSRNMARMTIRDRNMSEAIRERICRYRLSGAGEASIICNIDCAWVNAASEK